ncbi:MAG: hypothetical protein COA58_08090 [Bacteroidetes bacterium]|nr:MAG: hypothetical protein COA58_08090 [Bacteroidota bacterium]
MVKRYNTCLSDIGLKNTKLKKFHIDGWGWSPEVAEELDNRFYMSHGLANPYGIIISPKQEDSSIYMPFHSFDVAIHKTIFKQYKNQIKDITAQCGLWFELDQEISAYRSPQDLLMIDYMRVNFTSVDRVMFAAKEQRTLIREFYDVKQAWSNVELREKIIESSQKNGDLRFRKFDIPIFPFSDVDNYYTVAFNGLFVLKNLNSEKPLLVHMDNKSSLSAEAKHTHIEYNIEDPQLLSYLYSNNIVSDKTKDFASQKVLLEIAKDYTLVKAALDNNEKTNIAKLSKTQKKGVVNQLLTDGLLPDEYFELERIINLLDNNEKKPSVISDCVRTLLLHPDPSLDNNQKLVIWKMLCKLNQTNPLLTYLFDKSSFYNQYAQWPKQLQIWVVELLLKHKNIYNQLI